jgi:cytoplasmic iron level regulating protein YaaA (DUF328/UPF0246 family)
MRLKLTRNFYAKKARGMMVNYAIKNKIIQAEELKNFTAAGYQYAEHLSDDRAFSGETCTKNIYIDAKL